MGIEYRLTLAGDIPSEALAARAMPERADRPAGIPGGPPALLGAALYESHGFYLTIVPTDRASVAAVDDDDELRMWDIGRNSMVSFDMDKFDSDEDTARAIVAMLSTVRRVLESGTEDAALTLNGDWLLLNRIDGVVRRFNRTRWWAHHDVDDLIEG
ncbi:hypothetical protein J2S43_005124 [Catenuloplanes nepalensis]|uniref:Uncharacterized protein n=1 Tax=Catenuloplanes nepalensis TaxID=587533 RepID=A0ABT9MYT6_9ACTN|nr:SitI3 family protein [Catenuloplanes nepalensis]MDP9796612.1 hypothetical protein [Catenuloplanes nepalensis]